MIETSISGFFQNLDLILDGILPETDGEEEMDEGTENRSSPFVDEIHQYFDEVRNIFTEMLKPSCVLSKADSNNLKKDEKCRLPTSKVKKEKMVICQYQNCNFRTTKNGLENGEAARHIINHGLTSRDLKTRGPFFKIETRNRQKLK